MNSKILGVVGLAVVLGGGLTSYAWLQPSADDLFIQECETLLSDRLKAPATYARVNASEQSRSRTSFEEFLDIDHPDKMRMVMMGQAASAESREAFEALKKVYADGSYETVKVLLTYDAANAYGTPVRGTSICSQIVGMGEPVAVGVLSGTRIDGFDRVRWATYQVWQLQQ